MDKLLDEKQAAALLNVSVKTLQARRGKGGGARFVKLGRSVRYSMADLEAFVVASQRTSTSDRGQPPVSQLRPGITIRRVPERERVLDRAPTVARTPPLTARPAPGAPTGRRHCFLHLRPRRRIVFPAQRVDGSEPRPLR